MAGGSCLRNGIRQSRFCLDARKGGPVYGGERTGPDAIAGIRLEIFEAAREFLSLLDDLLHAAWHPHHLRNFGLAFMA